MNDQPTYVLFVGGPSDGRHMVMHHCPRAYRVALYPDIAPAGAGSANDAVVLQPQSFTYLPLRFGGRQFYVPEDWVNAPPDPYERLMTALTRGYVGRP